MQIYINGKFLTQSVAGVQRYAYELTKCLVEREGSVRILVPKNFNTNNTQIPENYFIKTGNYKNLNLWEQVHLPMFMFKRNGLLINLCNTAPLLFKNQVVCLHDIAFMRNPQWYSRSFYLYYRFLIPKIVRNSRHVVTVSEFSKQEITNLFTLADKKVSIVYNAPATNFICPSINDLAFDKEDFFLFVGSFDPRKNLSTLLKAFASPKLKNKRLIVVGKKWNTFNYNETTLPPNVTMLDDCNDELLASLYKRAKALINCSLYEGFGLPIVEAAASGCPLLLSDIDVFREIAGEYAIYFSPNDVDSIINAVELFEQCDTEAVNHIIKNNYRNSYRFTWQQSSKQLQRVVNSLLPFDTKPLEISSSVQ